MRSGQQRDPSTMSLGDRCSPGSVCPCSESSPATWFSVAFYPLSPAPRTAFGSRLQCPPTKILCAHAWGSSPTGSSQKPWEHSWEQSLDTPQVLASPVALGASSQGIFVTLGLLGAAQPFLEARLRLQHTGAQQPLAEPSLLLVLRVLGSQCRGQGVTRSPPRCSGHPVPRSPGGRASASATAAKEPTRIQQNSQQ